MNSTMGPTIFSAKRKKFSSPTQSKRMLCLIRHTFDAKYSFLDILYVYGELHNLWMY